MPSQWAPCAMHPNVRPISKLLGLRPWDSGASADPNKPTRHRVHIAGEGHGPVRVGDSRVLVVCW